MLSFERFLAEAGVDPTTCAVLRHTAADRRLNALLPSYAAERRDLFNAYQSVQAPGPARMLRGCTHIASFIGQEKGKATFAGLWRVGEARTMSTTEALALPHIADLVALGMTLAGPDAPPETRFDLEPLPTFEDWIGRLLVTWPVRGINWWIRAHNHAFPILALTEESRFAQPLPPWSEMTLGWRDLPLLPPSWRLTMAQWRGVYFIFDEAQGRGYVGAASGEENILQRWGDYARDGHGGDVRLRTCRPEDLRFSILQLTAQDTPRAAVEALEASWKVRLHTRDHGLNGN